MSGFDDLLKKGLDQGSLSHDEILIGLMNERISPKILADFIKKIKVQGIFYYSEHQSYGIHNLIAKGKRLGYLAKHEVIAILPSEIQDEEQISDILEMIKDMGIKIQQ